ncbi:MAG: DNA polymerase III subunit alpha [Planctomycetes bacterium]|nr:DNA polymerase III subunit alpha [Planctomycetota bacterium]
MPSPDSGSLQTPRFAHLHLHTHYSLLDGATRIAPLMERVKAMNMPAVAMTDHGNMFATVEFYKAALDAGVKPIIGSEFYIAPDSRFNKEYPGRKQSSYHLLLLAMNRTGYENMLRLSSLAYLEGFYYKPRIDKEVLRELSEGLICTSTCLGGEIPQAFVSKDRSAAESLAKEYLSIFGPDRFFVELQDHGIAEQRVLNPELVEMADRLGVATIATNDVHYLDEGDVEAHDILCCINTGKLVSDENRFKFETGEFYLKSPQQMAELFPQHPEALSNTLLVAEMCNLDFEFNKRYAPVYEVAPSTTPEAELSRIVYEAARRKYDEITDEVRERIDYELEVISSKGFSSYFLIVWDLVQYARKNNIPCGARGSGCSSVVAYCLDISAPEPLTYGLYFERFMDPDRDEMPDIDVDICQNGRARIIEYVREKYGHVAQIITFGTLKAKAAVKDVSRVMGLGFEEANKLTALIPAELRMTIDKALEQEPELRNRYDTDPKVKRVIDISRKLEGLARHAGVHAAGVVIADKSLDRFLPLYRGADADAVVTQFDGPTVEAVGLLKMDFLGLRTLSVLQRSIDLAKELHGVEVDIEHVDLTDKQVYSLFVAGHTKGIFQFESGGMRDVIMRIQPNRIQDLIAANALYRPGPMKYIDDYVARKHGANWSTPHPAMTEVLNETYGIMVYQEQVSRMVNRLGGVELKQAFRLAKFISKKNFEKIESNRKPFIEGCLANGLDEATAQKVFDDILEFGGYAFNKAHSTGYAIVAFQTAYMKHYHPVEFMAALLTFEMGTTAKVQEYIDECRRLGIEVAPPDVNASGNDFTPDVRDPDRKVIRFGLAAIKGVGSKAVEAIVRARDEGCDFKSIFDFCERVDLTAVNKTVVEALICCGAFDDTGAMRKPLMLVAEDAISGGQRAQQDRKAGQFSLFGGGDEDSSPQKTATPLPQDEWNEAEMLAREKAVLGFFVTRHPLTSCTELVESCSTATTVDLNTHEDNASVILGGLITDIRYVLLRNSRKKGERMGILTLEDIKGKTEVTISPRDLEKFRSLLKPDAIVFVRGTVSRRREEPSVRASEIIPAAQAARVLCDCVVVRLDERCDDPTIIERLFAITAKHSGPCPLYVEVQTTDHDIATIKCRNDMSVEPSPQCLHELASLIGEARVICTGPTRQRIPWAQFSNAECAEEIHPETQPARTQRPETQSPATKATQAQF